MMVEDGSNIVPLISSDSSNSKRRSIFLVKLTDSSRSTLDHLLKKMSFKSSSADFGSVEIGENEGCIRFGESTGITTTEYKFSIADMHSELAKGQLQTTRQCGDLNPVESLGQITQRLKILASDKETFESTKQKALQEMEEAKKQSDKITSVKLKPPGSSKFSQKNWQKVATASPIQRPLTPLSGGSSSGGPKPMGKTVTPPGASSSSSLSSAATVAKYGELAKKSLRQRIIQHLALRPSTPSALLSRITKEGLFDDDKSSFDSYLNDVAQPKPQSNGEMELRQISWTEVRTDWPHYAKYDAEVVKKYVAAKKLVQNNSNSLSSSAAKGVDSTMFKKDESMGKSRVVPPPPPTNAEKNSNSNLTGTSPFLSLTSPSHYSSPLDQIIPDPEQGRRRTALKRRNQSSSLSLSGLTGSNNNGEILPPPAKEVALEKGKYVNSEITVVEDSKKSSSESSSKSVNRNVVLANGRATQNGLPSSSSSSLPNVVQNRSSNKMVVNKEERRKKERERTQNELKHSSPVNNVTNNNNEDISAKSTDINQTTTATDDVDYLKKFPPIRNGEERRRYKDLFDKDYNQYMDAYNKLHDVAVEFEKLGERLDKLIDKESNEYKSIEREIYMKYKKFEQDPIMIRCKTDHERLRSKLAVLKERVKEYDES